MTDLSPNTCSVEGAEVFGPAMSETDICERFTKRLADALAGQEAAQLQDVALSIRKPGTIDAVVAVGSQAGQKSYPAISIDVVDRQLKPSDLDSLADTVAQVIAADISGKSQN